MTNVPENREDPEANAKSQPDQSPDDVAAEDHCSSESEKISGKKKSAKAPFFRRPLFQAIIIFLVLWVIYNSSGRLIGGSDCYAARFLPVNLVLYGSYHYDNLTFLRGEDGKGGMPGGQVMRDKDSPSYGHLITYYPVLIPTLLAPFYYIPFKVFEVSPESYWPFYMDKFFMGAFVAGAALFLFLSLAKVKVKFWGRLLLTIAFALGTSNWAISSQAFWQHGPSAFFLAFSLFMLLKLRQSVHWIGPIGLVTGLSAGARPTNAIWFMLVALYIFVYLIRERKGWWRIFWYFAWASPVVLFNVWYNWAYFGDPFTSGYDYNPVNRYIADFLHIHNFPAGFRGLLFSTSLGLLPNAPFFIFCIPAFFHGRKRNRLPWLALFPATSHAVFRVFGFMLGRDKSGFPELGIRRILWIFVFAHIILYSCYREWWAGFSFAYRYLTDIMPFMCFLLFPVLYWKPFRKGLFVIFIILLLWGMSIQFYGAYLWSGSLWYGRYWKNLTKQLLVNKEALKKGQLFGEHSVHWSLDPEEHYIGIELKHFRFSRDWWLTPEKIKRDLATGRKVQYGKYAPIILIFGEKRR